MCLILVSTIWVRATPVPDIFSKVCRVSIVVAGLELNWQGFKPGPLKRQQFTTKVHAAAEVGTRRRLLGRHLYGAGCDAAMLPARGRQAEIMRIGV
jgi:hypothetical protein